MCGALWNANGLVERHRVLMLRSYGVARNMEPLFGRSISGDDHQIEGVAKYGRNRIGSDFSGRGGLDASSPLEPLLDPLGPDFLQSD